MHLRVGQLTHKGFLMFHPDHRTPVTLKGDRMLEQVDGQHCSMIQLQPDSVGAADRPLARCFSQRLRCSCRTDSAPLLEMPESTLHRQLPLFFQQLKKFQNMFGKLKDFMLALQE